MKTPHVPNPTQPNQLESRLIGGNLLPLGTAAPMQDVNDVDLGPGAKKTKPVLLSSQAMGFEKRCIYAALVTDRIEDQPSGRAGPAPEGGHESSSPLVTTHSGADFKVLLPGSSNSNGPSPAGSAPFATSAAYDSQRGIRQTALSICVMSDKR